MTARENALRLLRFDSPEYVMADMPVYGIGYHGIDHQGYSGGGHDCPVGSIWTDIWGTVWHKEHEGVMGYPKGYPLAEISALKNYDWPNPDDERIYGPLYAGAGKFDRKSDHFLGGRHRDTLWEKAYMLCGMENMMAYFHTEPDFAREILRRIMDFQMGMARHYLAAGIEYVALGDDLGTQGGPLLGPRVVREFLVPEYRRLFDLYKAKGIIVEFHSCGNVDHALDIFMKLGVDLLNPVQATANDLAAVRAKTQGRMALRGGISSGLIMQGPVARIRQEVRAKIDLLGREGGYFCTQDQSMPFAPEHVRAVMDAVREFGDYRKMEFTASPRTPLPASAAVPYPG